MQRWLGYAIVAWVGWGVLGLGLAWVLRMPDSLLALGFLMGFVCLGVGTKHWLRAAKLRSEEMRTGQVYYDKPLLRWTNQHSIIFGLILTGIGLVLAVILILATHTLG